MCLVSERSGGLNQTLSHTYKQTPPHDVNKRTPTDKYVNTHAHLHTWDSNSAQNYTNMHRGIHNHPPYPTLVHIYVQTQFNTYIYNKYTLTHAQKETQRNRDTEIERAHKAVYASNFNSVSLSHKVPFH